MPCGGPILIRVLSYIGRHRRLVAIQIPVLAISIALLVWRVDILEGLRGLPDLRPGWMLLGLVTFTASKAIHAYRWRVFLQHREAPLMPLFGIFLASNLANALVPFRAGDLLRIELPNRLLNLPRAELVSSVLIVETIFDGLAFALLLLAAVALFGDLMFALPALAAFAILVLVVFVGLSWLSRLGVPDDPEGSALLRWLPDRWRGNGARITRQFIEGMSSLRDPQRIAGALLVSIVAWLAEVSVYWMLGRAFGFELDAGEAIVLMIAGEPRGLAAADALGHRPLRDRGHRGVRAARRRSGGRERLCSRLAPRAARLDHDQRARGDAGAEPPPGRDLPAWERGPGRAASRRPGLTSD